MNRIRDVRLAKGWTLADLAAACDPPTTAQTIGRLETGMRGLSVLWLERLAAALGVDRQELLAAGPETQTPMVVARLTADGAEGLSAPRAAVSPLAFGDGAMVSVLAIEAAAGEYRPGDQLWLERIAPEAAARALNRDVLAPRRGGRFAFGRLVDRQGARLAILPPGYGAKQVIVDEPAWIAVAHTLVRRL